MSDILEMRFDPTVDAAYIRLSKQKVHSTREEGDFIVDYSRSGRVVGLEVLHFSKYLEKHKKLVIPQKYLHPKELQTA